MVHPCIRHWVHVQGSRLATQVLHDWHNPYSLFLVYIQSRILSEDSVWSYPNITILLQSGTL